MQQCSADSPRRICSPNSCETLPALWSVPVLAGSGTSSVFNLCTYTDLNTKHLYKKYWESTVSLSANMATNC